MAKNYAALARSVIAALGGVDNISAVTHCMTRLRFVIKDDALIDSPTLKTIPGVLGVVRSDNQCQVIIGNTVSQAFQEVVSLLPGDMQPAQPVGKPKLTLRRIGAGIDPADTESPGALLLRCVYHLPIATAALSLPPFARHERVIH